MGLSLEVKGLSHRYGSRVALEDASFSLLPGSVLGLLGPNGAGKTTLVKLLLGLCPKSAGLIRVGDDDLDSLSARQRAKLIAYVPQSSALAFPFKVREVVLMGRFAHIKFGRVPGRADVAAMEGALEEMRIGHLADRRFQELSGGERQLTLMARALAQNAMILLLDEPTANLDFANQGAVLNMVKKIAKIGRSVLMTTHFPNHAFVAADQTALIKSGRILACGPTEDVLTGQSLSAIYGTKIAVVSAQIPGYGLEVKLCAPIPEEG